MDSKQSMTTGAKEIIINQSMTEADEEIEGVEPMSISKDVVNSVVERPAGLNLAMMDDDEIFERASANQTDYEVAVPVTPTYETFKKLEVVNSKLLNFMAVIYNIISFTALALSLIIIILARSKFSETLNFFDPNLASEITIYIFPNYFDIIDSILSFVVFTYAVILLCVYCVILFRVCHIENILNEQIWVMMLLVYLVLYLNPYEASLRLRRSAFGIQPPSIDDGFNYINFFIALRITSFTVIYLLYFWFGTHSYRILDRRVSHKDWTFYFHKMIILAIYIIYKIVMLYKYNVIFSEVPFMSLIAFLRLYGAMSVWPTLGVVSVLLLTIMEIIIASIIGISSFKTFNLLKKSDYAKHRTNILGYRFFLHQHIIFNMVFLLTYLFLLFGLPIGAQITEFALRFNISPGKGSYFDVQYAPFGLYLCLLAFATTEAYTNLPANANIKDSLVIWKKLQNPFAQKKGNVLTPVVYRNREPRSNGSLQIIPNYFVMQTNIELFNLSWFVYYHGTKKEKTVNIDFDSQRLRIRDCLYDSITDTKAIVAESNDRIIFAFKGTSSNQNVVTDLKVSHRSLSSVISQSEYEFTSTSRGNNNNAFRNSNPEQELEHIRNTKLFRRAKVHTGFANAYNKIKHSVIRVAAALIKEKDRPICFTGHSLGGALATISSLDVKLTLGLSNDQIAVSSFGSPRVGNESFREIYDNNIKTHWRFVAGGDFISRVPKIGYTHTGKEVILTSNGEMFIDPCILEVIFLHRHTSSLIHHRKSCYLLALKSWCDNRGDYSPNLWPFPISNNDNKKFDSTFKNKSITQGGLSSSRFTMIKRKGGAEEYKLDRAARMQGYADAIDALGDISPQPVSSETLELWRRLGDAALEKLQSEVSQSTTSPEENDV